MLVSVLPSRLSERTFFGGPHTEHVIIKCFKNLTNVQSFLWIHLKQEAYHIMALAVLTQDLDLQLKSQRPLEPWDRLRECEMGYLLLNLRGLLFVQVVPGQNPVVSFQPVIVLS